MNKPIIGFVSDGRRSTFKLLGYDITKCVRELHIETSMDNDPLNVTVSLKLERLDSADRIEAVTLADQKN